MYSRYWDCDSGPQSHVCCDSGHQCDWGCDSGHLVAGGCDSETEGHEGCESGVLIAGGRDNGLLDIGGPDSGSLGSGNICWIHFWMTFWKIVYIFLPIAATEKCLLRKLFSFVQGIFFVFLYRVQKSTGKPENTSKVGANYNLYH